MAKTNPIEIYKHLNRSNCRKCGVPTCMAFAAAVINADKALSDCPHIDKQTAAELEAKIVRREPDNELENILAPLKKDVSNINFQSIAQGIGAEIAGSRLRIKCLGKDFFVSQNGEIESSIHINVWISIPLLRYIKTGGSSRPGGKWISFEELENGPSMAPYFQRRCEGPMRQFAESHTDIFFDLLNIFGANKAEGFSSDYAQVIYPLPRVPFLILYSRPEEQFESNLRILLDSSTNSYLDTHAVYVLGRGIVEMFKNILSRHEEIMPSLLAL